VAAGDTFLNDRPSTPANTPRWSATPSPASAC